MDAENAVTFKYLDSLPVRDVLKKRITELWNYPKVTMPRYEGRHWFYSRNSGLQRQSVVFTRETLNGSETVALDPNSLSPDGAMALSGFVSPSKKDFRMRVKISRKESKESRYWLRPVETGGGDDLEKERDALIQESTELLKILSAILRNSE